MAEKTAAELLYAQLDHDVAQAKQALGTRFSGDLLETLAEAVTKRWWIKRMTVKQAPVDAIDMVERMQHRMNILANIVQGIINHSGEIDLNGVQMQVLGMSAELNALWGCLIELGLITQANRQDYMDAAIASLYHRSQQEFQKIVIPGSNKLAS